MIVCHNITNSINAALAQAIAGLGGVGKSQLVIEYAYRAYEKKSYQIIWFVNGQNLDGDYLRLAAQLKIYGENKDDIIERTKHKLQELGNYLLIIDDAENHEAINSYLPRTGKNGHVLITTRHRLDWPQMLELGVFTLIEALGYFKKVTSYKDEEIEDVTKLVKQLLGLLPLALTQAGAFIKQTGISVKEYIEFFETKHKELWGVEDKARDYTQTIAVTWDITINRIKQKDPLAENLLQGMSYFASTPNKIDQSWLSELVENEQIRITTLDQLANYSMIEKHQVSDHFTVHALVQEVVFDSLTPERQQSYLEQVSAVLKAIYPCKSTEQTEDYWLQSQLLVHLEALLKRLEAYQATIEIDGKDLETIQKQDLKQVHLLVLLAHGYGNPHLGNNAQRKKILLERALVILEKHLGPEHPELTKTLANLGNAYGALGDAQKEKALLKRALNIKVKHYGPEHPEVAKTSVNLGNAYGASGYAQKQKTLLERSLVILEKHYGPEHPEVAITLMNLSNVYGALGDAQKQKTLLERALVILEKHYGPKHPQVAIALVNLGNAYGALGDAQKEKALLNRALKIKENHYGLEHTEVAKVLVNLSNACTDAQQKKTLLEGALSIKEKHFGADHPEVAKVLTSLGNAYGELGDVEKKKELQEHALFILEDHFGPDHQLLAIVLISLGNAYGALGDLNKKEALLERVLKINEKYYGSEYPEVAIVLLNLSDIYKQLSNMQKATEFIQRAYDIFYSHPNCGPQHPHTQNAWKILDEYKKLATISENKEATFSTISPATTVFFTKDSAQNIQYVNNDLTGGTRQIELR